MEKIIHFLLRYQLISYLLQNLQFLVTLSQRISLYHQPGGGEKERTNEQQWLFSQENKGGRIHI
jgi:hypothetical protein